MGCKDWAKWRAVRDSQGSSITARALLNNCREEKRKQVEEGLTNRAQSDSATQWYNPADPGAGAGGYPGGSLFDYFNSNQPSGFGKDPYYANAKEKLNNALYDIDPAGSALYGQSYEGPAGDTVKKGIDQDPLDDDTFWAKYGDEEKLQAEIEKLYKQLMVSKAKGDSRFEKGFPPEGFKDPGMAGLNNLDAKNRAAALNKADDDATKNWQKAVASAAEVISAAKSVGFREQCFLLSQIVPITRYKVDTLEVQAAKAVESGDSSGTAQENQHPPKPRPYTETDAVTGKTNACIMVQGDPFDFMNRLTVPTNQQGLLTMPTAEIANLQPVVQFYKIVPTDTEPPRNLDPDRAHRAIPIRFATSFNDVPVPAAAGFSRASRAELMGIDALKSRRKRGYGVGIKSFDVKFIGTNPFAAKRDLTAQLTIFANSFGDLLKVRGSTGSPYRYIDLALKTISDPKLIQKYEGVNAKNGQQTDDNLDSLDFTIRATVGFQPPPTPLYTAKQAAIRDNKITIDMTPTTHEFNFNPDGTLEFVINFKPWISEQFSSQQYDIFSDEDLHAITLESILRLDKIRKTCDSTTVASFKKDQMKEIDKVRPRAIASLTRRISVANRLKYLYLPTNLLSKINREGPLFDFATLQKAKWKVKTEKGLKKEIKEATAKKKAKEDTKPIASEAVGYNQHEVPFVYVSDLIDAVLEGIDLRLSDSAHEKIMKKVEKSLAKKRMTTAFSAEARQELKEKNRIEYQNFKKFRVVLGPIELVNPTNPADILIANLGDLPISLKYLNEFLTSQTLKKDLYRYPVNVFLDNLINTVLKNFLNDDTCFKAMVKQRTHLRRGSFVAYQKHTGDSDDLTNLMNLQIPPDTGYTMMGGVITFNQTAMARVKGGKTKNKSLSRLYPTLFFEPQYKPLLDVVGNGKSLDHPTHNFMVFSTGRTPPVGLYQGNVDQDSLRGVMHYSIGRDRGIVKDLKLVRDKRKYIAETRFAQEGYDGLKQLRETYSIEARTVGNFGVWPGQKIYVDPQGWVPHLSEDLSEIFSGPEGLTQFGIGGYYDVMQVEHTLKPGNFETTFTAKWTAQIESPTAIEATTGASPNQNAASPVQKCTYLQKPEKAASPTPEPEGAPQTVPDITNARQAALAKSNLPPESLKYVIKMPAPSDAP